ncbi:hypothetical protein PV08_02253 [Exophiala spinifera]|uniref:ChrR-like cupin domain-containing protein n=1 Tax=Exophiala spinifera TaxID=91928 RepID=A0A0D2BRH2_9EURO|nr:uncharacterized protein PV08_02253 [Exophiala spinifera]KIW21673.1 hypothetical protein PV08_02253 [Exophiala spinifera]
MSTIITTSPQSALPNLTLANDTAKPVTSETERIKENTERELDIAARKGAPDVYVDAEKDTDWFHWQGTIYVKPLRFENRSGTYVIMLKTAPEAQLGKHRHRGEVRALTVKGSWGYHEYGWTAKAGDYINENPGTIHTLWMGRDSEVMFNVTGSIEFFNDNGELREIMDLFSFWRMYVDHCHKKGVPANENLWF